MSEWVKVAQSCPTLCDPMDYTVHGILQARILKQVAFPFSRGSSQPQGLKPGLLHCRWILYQLSHKGSPRILEWVAYPFSRGSSWPRNRTRVSCIAGRFYINWAMREEVLGQLKPIQSFHICHSFVSVFMARDQLGFSDMQADSLVRKVRHTRWPWRGPLPVAV